MPFVDPSATQNPTTNLIADDAWGDAVNLYQNDLRGVKAGCLLSTVAATAIGTKTIIPFATEVYDNQACHSTVSNTSRITVPSGWGGLYYVTANMRSTDTQFTMYFVLNGDTTNGLLWACSSNAYTGGDDSKCSMAMVYRFAVADYVEVAMDSTTGTVYTGDANYFGAQWMHS